MPSNPLLAVYICGAYLCATIFALALFTLRDQTMRIINHLAETIEMPVWVAGLIMAVIYSIGWPIALIAFIVVIITTNGKK